jgi:hypothetical protein
LVTHQVEGTSRLSRGVNSIREEYFVEKELRVFNRLRERVFMSFLSVHLDGRYPSRIGPEMNTNSLVKWMNGKIGWDWIIVGQGRGWLMSAISHCLRKRDPRDFCQFRNKFDPKAGVISKWR